MKMKDARRKVRICANFEFFLGLINDLNHDNLTKVHISLRPGIGSRLPVCCYFRLKVSGRKWGIVTKITRETQRMYDGQMRITLRY